MVKPLSLKAKWALAKRDYLRLRTRIFVRDADRNPTWVFYHDREANAHEMSKLRKLLWGRE